jgi:hypothetical protein
LLDDKRNVSTTNIPEDFKFVNDEPILTITDDKFRHSYFVRTLEYILEHSSSPINIGLYGRWGVGKSSILHLLEEVILKNKSLKNKFSLFYIDVWKFSSLKQELLLEMNNILPEKIRPYTTTGIIDLLYNIKEERPVKEPRKWCKIRSMIGDFVLFLLPAITGAITYFYNPSEAAVSVTPVVLLSFIPGLIKLYEKFKSLSKSIDWSSKKIIPGIESSYQFETIFRQIVEKATDGKEKKELVMAIDNLDRCDDGIVIEFLGMIKTFMNIKGCIFVIACDDEAILKHLASARGNSTYDTRTNEAMDYLTKFFQVTLKIPPFFESELGIYTENLINDLGLSFDADIKQILALGVAKNPRKINQLINNFVVLYKLAQFKENENLI